MEIKLSIPEFEKIADLRVSPQAILVETRQSDGNNRFHVFRKLPEKEEFKEYLGNSVHSDSNAAWKAFNELRKAERNEEVLKTTLTDPASGQVTKQKVHDYLTASGFKFGTNEYLEQYQTLVEDYQAI